LLNSVRKVCAVSVWGTSWSKET